MRLILASASPRRAELLRAAGFGFDIAAPDVDERLRDGESPDAYVARLASEKSASAMPGPKGPGLQPQGPGVRGDLARRPGPFGPGGDDDVVVLGADTTVVVDAHILGKPRDHEEAARMLRQLSGRWHDVVTGVSVRRGPHELVRVERTRVSFAPLSDADLAWYIASGEGGDKAGAYAIQGLASRFIPRIDGSYSNVVGLPIALVAELLRDICIAPADRLS